MDGLESLGEKMSRRSKEIDRNVNKLVKEVALTVHQTVVVATPIDEGHAKSNWRLALGSPLPGTITAYSPNGGAVTNEIAAIEQARGAVRGRKLGQPVSIGNNLPYIGKLNSGSSRQAPEMFVRMALLSGIVKVAKARIVRC